MVTALFTKKILVSANLFQEIEGSNVIKGLCTVHSHEVLSSAESISPQCGVQKHFVPFHCLKNLKKRKRNFLCKFHIKSNNVHAFNALSWSWCRLGDHITELNWEDLMGGLLQKPV